MKAKRPVLRTSSVEKKLEHLKSRVRKRTRELEDANRALLESEERYRELVSNLTDGVLVHKFPPASARKAGLVKF